MPFILGNVLKIINRGERYMVTMISTLNPGDRFTSRYSYGQTVTVSNVVKDPNGTWKGSKVYTTEFPDGKKYETITEDFAVQVIEG